ESLALGFRWNRERPARRDCARRLDASVRPRQYKDRTVVARYRREDLSLTRCKIDAEDGKQTAKQEPGTEPVDAFAVEKGRRPAQRACDQRRARSSFSSRPGSEQECGAFRSASAG